MNRKTFFIISKALSFVIYIAVGLVVGLILANFGGRTIQQRGVLALIPLVLILVVAYFLQIIIHELGHLIFGLMTGYRFKSFRIGSLMLIRNADGKLSFKRLSIAGTAGQCLMGPPDIENGKIMHILYNFGGVIANLTAAVIFDILYIYSADGIYKPAFYLFMAVTGFALAVVNGIPMQQESVNNDGMNAMMLGQDPEAMNAFWLQLKVNELTADGQRLKDMPAEWFYLPEKKYLLNYICAVRGVLYCNRLLDQHRFEEAAKSIYDLRQSGVSLVGLHESLLRCDQIYCHIVNKDSPDKAKQLWTDDLKKFMKSMKDYPSVLRTQYAYAMKIEKDFVKAEELKSRFEKVSESYPYPSEIAAEKELIRLVTE